MSLKAPFPWFGGKSRIATEVWARFGDVPNYVEPFAGSLAVLLGRPTPPHIETVNDKDCYLANFWRAIQADPNGVAQWAEWPVNEADLHARHEWLIKQEDFRQRMHQDPDFYDVKIAGWWVWGLCQWIGHGWCAKASQQLPHLGDGGVGVHKMSLTSQQRPHLTNRGMGIANPSASIYQWFQSLQHRLRYVRVCCGEWHRLLGPTPTIHNGITGVLLDPPYSHKERTTNLYAIDDNVSEAVRQWAIANGDNPKLRVALCGYQEYAWVGRGGYGNQGQGRARDNKRRERIWFSPACLRPEPQEGLFPT